MKKVYLLNWFSDSNKIKHLKLKVKMKLLEVLIIKIQLS